MPFVRLIPRASAEDAITFPPDDGKTARTTSAARRSFCGQCGSPLTGRYEYLPGQVYVPVGLFDNPHVLAPQLHAHTANRVAWLLVDDDLERFDASARSALNKMGGI